MECVIRKKHNQNLSKARGVMQPMKTTSRVATGVFQERAPLAETEVFLKVEVHNISLRESDMS